MSVAVDLTCNCCAADGTIKGYVVLGGCNCPDDVSEVVAACEALAASPPWGSIPPDMNYLQGVGDPVFGGDCSEPTYTSPLAPAGPAWPAYLNNMQYYAPGSCSETLYCFIELQYQITGPWPETCITWNVNGTSTSITYGPVATGHTLVIVPPTSPSTTVASITDGSC